MFRSRHYYLDSTYEPQISFCDNEIKSTKKKTCGSYRDNHYDRGVFTNFCSLNVNKTNVLLRRTRPKLRITVATVSGY